MAYWIETSLFLKIDFDISCKSSQWLSHHYVKKISTFEFIYVLLQLSNLLCNCQQLIRQINTVEETRAYEKFMLISFSNFVLSVCSSWPSLIFAQQMEIDGAFRYKDEQLSLFFYHNWKCEEGFFKCDRIGKNNGCDIPAIL